MKKIFISLLTILTACTSCKEVDICKDEKLSLNKVEFTGSQLRIDGFYYGRPTTDYQGAIFYDVFIFYKNGVLMRPGNIGFEKMEDYISQVEKIELPKETKYNWGIFNIDNKILKIEHWKAAQCGYPSILRTGEILNDTTFILKKMEIRDNMGVTQTDINEDFHFRHFEIKPDSTNNFIR